jgi:hypothetical protein
MTGPPSSTWKPAALAATTSRFATTVKGGPALLSPAAGQSCGSRGRATSTEDIQIHPLPLPLAVSSGRGHQLQTAFQLRDVGGQLEAAGDVDNEQDDVRKKIMKDCLLALREDVYGNR